MTSLQGLAAHPLTSLIRQIELFAPLSYEDCQALVELPWRLRRLDSGSYLAREGEPVTHCAVLVNGFAFRQKVTGTGSRQIIALCIPGDAVDLQNSFLDVADHSVQLLTRATIADVPREALQDLFLARPALCGALIKLTLVEASVLREWVVNVGRRDARQRIAHVLCEFAVRLESLGLASVAHGFELPMTQEQLADVTGLTSVHVNRVLKGLQRDGLISREKRMICFPDWRALQNAADFTRNYLHIPAEDPLPEAA